MSDSVYEKALAHRNKLEAELKDLNHFVALYEKIAKMPFAQDQNERASVEETPKKEPAPEAAVEAKDDQPVEEFFRELDEQDREANIIMDDIVEVA